MTNTAQISQLCDSYVCYGYACDIAWQLEFIDLLIYLLYFLCKLRAEYVEECKVSLRWKYVVIPLRNSLIYREY